VYDVAVSKTSNSAIAERPRCRVV